jgi:DNA polymerase-3 subunit delta'
MSPTLGQWQVIVIEDADRITERGADALLRASRSRPSNGVDPVCSDS